MSEFSKLASEFLSHNSDILAAQVRFRWGDVETKKMANRFQVRTDFVYSKGHANLDIFLPFLLQYTLIPYTCNGTDGWTGPLACLNLSSIKLSGYTHLKYWK